MVVASAVVAPAMTDVEAGTTSTASSRTGIGTDFTGAFTSLTATTVKSCTGTTEAAVDTSTDLGTGAVGTAAGSGF